MPHRFSRAALLLTTLLLPTCDRSPSDSGKEPEPTGPSARFSVDQLTTTGPSCDYVQISSYGADSPTSSRARLQVKVQDEGIVAVTGIPMAGGATGYHGHAVWGRAPGTTRIIGTHGSVADTIVVTVTARATPLSMMVWRAGIGNYRSTGQAPEAVSLAVGATTTLGAKAVGCAGSSLPVEYVIAYASSNPSVVRVDNVVNKTVPGQQEFPTLVGEALITAVGRGTAQVTVTAPNSAPTTYTVTVP